MSDIVSTIKTKAIKYIIWVVISGGISFMGLVYGIYHAGELRIQAKWDADKAEKQRIIDELTAKSAIITKEEVIKYVDRIEYVEKEAKTITKYVNKYITVESDAKCVIPNNAILLLDSAAKNIAPKESVQ